MDILRGGAVVLVVFFHAGNTSQAPQFVQTVNDGLGSYRLAALFFASGLLLERSLAKGLVRFSAGKLRYLIWPYLVWTGLIMLPLIGLSRGLDPSWWIYPRGSHTWFLMALATMYAVGYLTRSIPPGWIALGFLVISQLVDRNGFELGAFVHDVSWWGTFFFVGVVLARNIEAALSAPVWVFLIGAGLTTVWFLLNAQPDGPAAKTLLAAVMTAVGVWTVVWALARLPLVWPLPVLEWLGRYSIVTYLVHVPVIRILVNYLGWPRDSWVGFLSLTAVVLLVCIVATRCYPQLRWLFEWPGPARSRQPDTAAGTGPQPDAPVIQRR